jgi:hypothetical protein
MSRRLISRISIDAIAAVALLAAPLRADIWPETWHGSSRTKLQAAPIEDRMLWVEYAGDASESAEYNGPVGKFTATAWRLKDSTSALAWYQSIRAANCTPNFAVALVCTTPGSVTMAHQNYVLRFEGWRPLERELAELFPQLPRLRSGGGLPLLPGYLPEPNRIRNSERYLLGVHSLQKFAPSIPATLAGFEDGAEAQMGSFQTTAGVVPIVVFSYITPQQAQIKVKEFEKQAGWVMRRSGPLIGLIPGGVDRKLAESLLGGMEYKAKITLSTPGKLPPMPNVAGMLVAIFELTGVLLVSCVGGGMLFAGLWFYLRKRQFDKDGTDATITVIHLQDG